MRKTIIEYFLIFAIIFGLSTYFYPTIWQQVVATSSSNELVIQGESPVYEFVAETVRHNILVGQNPFSRTDKVLFPYGWSYALDDVAPINGFFFVPLRYFLTSHQSFMLIVFLSVVISGITMYALLREFGIRKILSLLMSLIYCFTPFVSQRIGAHPTYTALYIFSLPALCFIKFYRTKAKTKFIYSLLFGMSLALAVLVNLYYAVMLVLLISLLAGSFLIFYYKQSLVFWISNLKYLLVSAVFVIIILLPWLVEVVKVMRFEPADIPTDRNDITTYSANLANYVVPSIFNPLYTNQVSKLIKTKPFLIKSDIENFVYPGFLILLVMIIYPFIRKKFPKFVFPIYITAIVFFVITLGPLLHVGEKVFPGIPLPYTFITQLPYIRMARVPARFVVPYIFLMVIVVSFLTQYLYIKLKGWRAATILLLLCILVFFDQRARLPQPTATLVPTKIYSYLSKEPSSPLLEIPFSIRDSIKYYGYMHAHWSPYTTLYHQKPIFGTYSGRINNLAYNYFTDNPIIGPIGKAIDLKTANPDSVIDSIDKEAFKRALNFYGLKFVLLNDDEVYSKKIASFLRQVQFSQVQEDNGYSLWERQLDPISLNSSYFDGNDDKLIFLYGWSDRDPLTNSRWIMREKVNLLLSFNPVTDDAFTLEAKAYTGKQTIKIYVNNLYAGSMTFDEVEFQRKTIQLPAGLVSGIANIQFELSPLEYSKNSLFLKVRYAGIERGQ